MFSESCQLYAIAALASRLCDALDGRGVLPERPKPRDLERLAKRLSNLAAMASDPSLDLSMGFEPAETAAARRDAKKREVIARSIESFGDDLRRLAALQRPPAPNPRCLSARPSGPLALPDGSRFEPSSPGWLVSLPTALNILKS